MITLEATVVTANGSILAASDAEHSYLFFGFRGGGVNFGVVTEFVLKVYSQQPTVYAGWLILKPASLEALTGVINEWMATIHENAGMALFLLVTPHGGVRPLILLFIDVQVVLIPTS